MADFDVVILSSSPTRAFTSHATRFGVPSSPNLPTIDPLLAAKPTLRNGDFRASVPSEFMSVSTDSSSTLKHYSTSEHNQHVDVPDALGPNVLDQDSKLRKSGTSRESDQPNGAAKQAVKAPRKSRAKSCKSTGCDMTKLKEKQVRKPRAKKTPTEEQKQTKIPRGKVTKLSTARLSKDGFKPFESTKLLQLAGVSHHFKTPQETPQETPKEIPVDALVRTSNLGASLSGDFAVLRRTNWTPPRDTDPSPLEIPSPEPSDAASCHSTSDSGKPPKTLGDLFGAYGYGDTATRPKPFGVTEDVGMRKRKLIELVKTNALLAGALPKSKVIKKKPRTITEMATAAYVEDNTSKSPGLLQYFGQKDLQPIPVTSRSTKKNNKSPTKRAVGTKPEFTLLSPQSALKQADTQEFVFGTSSQLVQDESPTFLRDLQAALRASNFNFDDPFSIPLSAMKSTTSGSSETVTAGSARSLWAAGSRGITGELMDIETIDLSTTPNPIRTETLAVNKSTQKSCGGQLAISEKLCVDLTGREATSSSLDNENPPTIIGPVEAAIRKQLLSSPSGAKSNVDVTVEKPPLKERGRAKKVPSIQKPDFNSFTTAKLAKEIKAYHFKPVKSRDAMIALLEKCWEGRQRLAMGNLCTNAILQTSPSKSRQTYRDTLTGGSPGRPRGRPRKDAVSPNEPTPIGAVLEHVKEPQVLSDSDTPLLRRTGAIRKSKEVKKLADDISDSDDPVTPSPPRRRNSLIGTPPLPLNLTIDDDVEGDSSLLLDAQQFELYKYITKAVKKCPRGTNSKNPSWHEKILLYDPIVLEDLAVWLNTGALETAGWDGEVTPQEVKRWCTEKSICCLWRENLRGGARARY